MRRVRSTASWAPRIQQPHPPGAQPSLIVHHLLLRFGVFALVRDQITAAGTPAYRLQATSTHCDGSHDHGWQWRLLAPETSIDPLGVKTNPAPSIGHR